MKKLLIFVMIMIAIGLFVVIACQIVVKHAAKGRMYDDLKEIPHREVGLLLGTNPLGRSGRPNQFYLRRIDAAVAVYEAGKVDRIIISGARRGDAYDETAAMREALVDRGVPDSILVLDGEGFRTIACPTQRDGCHRLQCRQHFKSPLEGHHGFARVSGAGEGGVGGDERIGFDNGGCDYTFCVKRLIFF